ncbi:MAG: hypothetical protein DHS80DRAFT_29104 [Piptocephalis tieghemiana]|nr:MAG: hypothetical protein DHS80DRAFT_29104 [Piptocephalis tieghemiana]
MATYYTADLRRRSSRLSGSPYGSSFGSPEPPSVSISPPPLHLNPLSAEDKGLHTPSRRVRSKARSTLDLDLTRTPSLPPLPVSLFPPDTPTQDEHDSHPPLEMNPPHHRLNEEEDELIEEQETGEDAQREHTPTPSEDRGSISVLLNASPTGVTRHVWSLLGIQGGWTRGQDDNSSIIGEPHRERWEKENEDDESTLPSRDGTQTPPAYQDHREPLVPPPDHRRNFHGMPSSSSSSSSISSHSLGSQERPMVSSSSSSSSGGPSETMSGPVQSEWERLFPRMTSPRRRNGGRWLREHIHPPSRYVDEAGEEWRKKEEAAEARRVRRAHTRAQRRRTAGTMTDPFPPFSPPPFHPSTLSSDMEDDDRTIVDPEMDQQDDPFTYATEQFPLPSHLLHDLDLNNEDLRRGKYPEENGLFSQSSLSQEAMMRKRGWFSSFLLIPGIWKRKDSFPRDRESPGAREHHVSSTTPFTICSILRWTLVRLVLFILFQLFRVIICLLVFSIFLVYWSIRESILGLSHSILRQVRGNSRIAGRRRVRVLRSKGAQWALNTLRVGVLLATGFLLFQSPLPQMIDTRPSLDWTRSTLIRVMEYLGDEFIGHWEEDRMVMEKERKEKEESEGREEARWGSWLGIPLEVPELGSWNWHVTPWDANTKEFPVKMDEEAEAEVKEEGKEPEGGYMHQKEEEEEDEEREEEKKNENFKGGHVTQEEEYPPFHDQETETYPSTSDKETHQEEKVMGWWEHLGSYMPAPLSLPSLSLGKDDPPSQHMGEILKEKSREADLNDMDGIRESLNDLRQEMTRIKDESRFRKRGTWSHVFQDKEDMALKAEKEKIHREDLKVLERLESLSAQVKILEQVIRERLREHPQPMEGWKDEVDRRVKAAIEEKMRGFEREADLNPETTPLVTPRTEADASAKPWLPRLFSWTDKVPQTPNRTPHPSANYALLSEGARVVKRLTSRTHYRSPFSLTRWAVWWGFNWLGRGDLVNRELVYHEPEVVLTGEEDLQSGVCWPVKVTERTSDLAITLSTPVYVTSFSLDHLVNEDAEKAESAPKTIELWEVRWPKDGPPLVPGTLTEEALPGWEWDGDRAVWAHHLHTVKYTPSTKRIDTLQTFPIPGRDQGLEDAFTPIENADAPGVDPILWEEQEVDEFGRYKARMIQIRITENWGNPTFTCLYGLRVHGAK